MPGGWTGSSLTRPSSVNRHRWNWWVANSPIHLESNRTYAFVLDCMGDCEGGNYVDIGRTGSDEQDPSTLPGWSIGDAMMCKDKHSMGMAGSAWSGNFVLAVDGTFRLNPGEPTPQIRIEGVPVSAGGRRSLDGSEASLTVSDARVREEPGATLSFAVALGSSRTQALTLHYETLDGTATAGEDYVRAAGRLVSAPGETRHTIKVPVLDDAHDEGEETLTVHLYDTEGAPLAGAVATGTIVNSDPIPKAWLAQFGKIVGAQIVDAVHGRLLGNPSTHVTVAAKPLWQPGEDNTMKAPAVPISPTVSRFLWRSDAGSADATRRVSPPASSFHLSTPTSGERILSAWGHVATGGFDVRSDDMRTDGTVTTGLVAMDVETDRWLFGAAASRSSADGSYGVGPAVEHERIIQSTLSILFPYVRFAPNDRTSLWALAGVGTGEQTVETPSGPLGSGIAMRMGALAATGTLLPTAATGAPGVTVRSDLLWVRMESDPVEIPRRLAATSSSYTRLRLVAEAFREFVFGRRGTLTPAFQLGVRHDGGDAGDGSGIEVGAALRYERARIAEVGAALRYERARIALEATVCGLLAHEQRGYEEWGASCAFRIEPEDSGLGLSFTFVPTIGAAPSGRDRLWQLQDAADLADSDEFARAGGLETELAYTMRTTSLHPD